MWSPASSSCPRPRKDPALSRGRAHPRRANSRAKLSVRRAVARLADPAQGHPRGAGREPRRSPPPRWCWCGSPTRPTCRRPDEALRAPEGRRAASGAARPSSGARRSRAPAAAPAASGTRGARRRSQPRAAAAPAAPRRARSRRPAPAPLRGRGGARRRAARHRAEARARAGRPPRPLRGGPHRVQPRRGRAAAPRQRPRPRPPALDRPALDRGAVLGPRRADAARAGRSRRARAQGGRRRAIRSCRRCWRSFPGAQIVDVRDRATKPREPTTPATDRRPMRAGVDDRRTRPTTISSDLKETSDARHHGHHEAGSGHAAEAAGRCRPSSTTSRSRAPSGGGVVTVNVTGQGRSSRRSRIDPSLLIADEKEILEDLDRRGA